MQANPALVEKLRKQDDRLPVPMADLSAGDEVYIPSSRPPARNKASRRSRGQGVVPALSAEVEAALQATAAQYGIDPALVLAMISQESGGKTSVTSSKGARGLMQLMPRTAQAYGLKVGNGVDERTDPVKSLEAGLHYFSDLLKAFNGDIKLALAGYNAGQGAVEKYGNQIPPYKETQDYVQKIWANYQNMPRRDIGGLTQSEQAELESLRAAMTQLQRSIDSLQYPAGTPMTTVTERGDIVGGAEADAGVPGQRIVQIPTEAEGSARSWAIAAAIDQQKELEQLFELQRRVSELEAKATSRNTSSDVPFDFSGIDIGKEQAAHVLEIMNKARGANQTLSEDVTQFATVVVPRALQAIPLPAVAATDAFEHLPPLIKKVTESAEEAEERMRGQLKSFADDITGIASRGFDSGWDGVREGFRQLLLDMLLDYMRSDLFKVLQKGFGVSESTEGGEKGGNLLGSLINSIFHRGGNGQGGQSQNGGQAQSVTPAQFDQTGKQIVQSTKQVGDANNQAIDTTGKAAAAGLGDISRSMLTGLTGIANMIAIGNSRGSFWKGLFAAAASGAINGAIGAVFGQAGSVSVPGGGGDHGSTGGSSGGGGGSTGESGHGFASGGLLKGPGTGTSDSILGIDRRTKQAMAWVSNDEYVIKAASVARLGKQTLDYINAFGELPDLTLPRRAEGGMIAETLIVPGSSGSGSGPAGISPGAGDNRVYNLDFKVTVNGGTGTQQERYRSARQIAREAAGHLQNSIRSNG
jgi:hypothetical protein